MTSTISKEQFEKDYATGLGKTVEQIREQGLKAEPCDCEDESCRGWQMVSAYEREARLKRPMRKEK
jgi:hypothetical protein